MNGSVLAVVVFVGLTLVVGVVAVGSFVGSFVGSLVFSDGVVFSSLEGEVPVLGFGVVGVVFGVGAVWLYPLVPSAARALAGISSTAAINTAAGTRSLRNRLDGPFLIGVVPDLCDLLEATTSILVMPTSRW